MKVNLGISWLSGIALLVGAILGIGISLVGTWGVWRSVPLINAHAQSILDLFDETLTSSAQGLKIVNDTLSQTVDTVIYVQQSAEDLSTSLNDTIPFIDNVGSLVGNDMKSVVEDTQTSLQSAETSARLVDDTLRVITGLPLIGNMLGQRYAPKVPLSQSIGDVANSLDQLPTSLTEIQTGLTATADNLRGIQSEVTVLKEKVTEAETQLESAQTVIADYQEQVDALQQRMTALRQSVPRWLLWYKWGMTVFFVWLGIAQIGLLLQGIHILNQTAAGKPAIATEPAGDSEVESIRNR
ncbi:MAG TPA: hypothetical protein VHO48_06690 [Anaerolineaceae bacterium]|nr:hypothetical protein [Anaerolineaceae bacterium]